MNRYFFHIRDGQTYLDDVGTPLPDLAAAQQTAMRAMGEIIRGANDSLWQGKPWRLWVTNGPDGSGATLLALECSGEKANAA
jgi:uncharacterized protein DUF6894